MASLNEALNQPPAVILLEGEAGVGKSRLVEEYLESFVGQREKSLVAGCPPIRKPFTLGPVIEAIRQHVDDLDARPLSGLAGALRPLFPEWASSLPPAPEALEDVRAARHRLFRALAELLDCLGVAVLVVEDVHWADEATLEFLLFLLSRRPAPLSVFVTYRPGDVPANSLLWRLSSRPTGGATRLRLSLEPLDPTETAALVSSMLDDEAVSAEFADFVHRCTGGIPLVIEEAVRLMVDRADLTSRNGEWVRRKLGVIDVPPTVRDAVLERCARLGDDARAVLEAAAILGEPVGEATILAVAGLDPRRAASALAEALRSGLLYENERGLLAMRHALAARALYDTIPGPLRRILHLRAGRILEGAAPLPLARLAHHFREAGETDEWCRYGEQAADLALASGDETTAARLLHDLLTDAALPAAAMLRLTSKLPFASATSADQFAGLAGALRSMLCSGTATPAERVELHLLLARILMIMEEFDAGRAELEMIARQVPPDSTVALQAMTLLGWPRGVTATASEHLRWLRRAARANVTSFAPANRLGSTLNRVTALLLIGEESGWAEATALPEEASSVPERRVAVLVQLNLSDAALLWGRYAEARQRLAKGWELVERHQYLLMRGMFLGTRARLDWLTGAWNGLAVRAAEIADDEDGLPLTRAEATLVAGLVNAANGEYDQAEGRFEYAQAECRRHGAVERYAEPAAALARLRLADGRIVEALRATDESIGIIARKGIWLWGTDIVPARVEALAAAGRVADAVELVSAFERGLHGRRAPASRAALVLCRALAAQVSGEHARAAALFSRAATAWEALPRPYDALLAREHQAECLHATGRDEAAADLLSGVYKGLSTLGAVVAADRVARRLRELGVDVRHTRRRGRRGYGDELSPSELEVVRMVVAGATNRRIAEALSRSTKTIEAHVNSAMRKLRVTSRTALAVAALDGGVVDKRATD
jgi:DNA-binding CsgD family transcriptional regulator